MSIDTVYLDARALRKITANQRDDASLHIVEEPIQFVGGVEVAFKFAGREFLAEVIEPPGEEVERGGEHFLIGENNVAPRGIGAPGEPQRIAETGTGKGDREPVFIEAVVEKRSKGNRGELREMRSKAHSVVMLLRAEPERPRANFFENFDEGRDARIFLQRRCAFSSSGSKPASMKLTNSSFFLPE